MTEYIDKEKLYQYLDNEVEWRNNQDRLFALESVSDFPAADVSPVVHGEWMRYSRTLWHYCSVCLEDALMSKSTGTEVLSSFCPHCGAKMDLEGK